MFADALTPVTLRTTAVVPDGTIVERSRRTTPPALLHAHARGSNAEAPVTETDNAAVAASGLLIGLTKRSVPPEHVVPAIALILAGALANLLWRLARP